MPSLMQAHAGSGANPFAASLERFEQLTSTLGSGDLLAGTAAQVEDLLHTEGLALMRQLLQDHLDLRTVREVPREVVGADDQARTHVRQMHRRLMTRFGPVEVSRRSYGAQGHRSLRPLDAELNLPVESYSHPLRRLAAETAATTSFDETIAALERRTAAKVPKRQVEELTARAAQDFEAFYEQRVALSRTEAGRTGSILVLSADGKGVVVRHDDLRDATREAAERDAHKLHTRLSPGEKRNRKRMATVAAVYTIAPCVRTPEQIVRSAHSLEHAEVARPRPEGKRVWASLEREAEEVIGAAFDEALRRDPGRRKRWVVVVDGNRTQLKLVTARALREGVALMIVLDVVHVIEYLWGAAWCFFTKGASEAERWVGERLLEILRGHSSAVAAGIRRKATLAKLASKARKAADDCADYLVDYSPYLRYDEYLAAGVPIASGVIEGACRHLIADRLDITGARWSLEGAEAVLRLRSVRSSGDFVEYWAFHLTREFERNHTSDYAGSLIPKTPPPAGQSQPLRLVPKA